MWIIVGNVVVDGKIQMIIGGDVVVDVETPYYGVSTDVVKYRCWGW